MTSKRAEDVLQLGNKELNSQLCIWISEYKHDSFHAGSSVVNYFYI